VRQSTLDAGHVFSDMNRDIKFRIANSQELKGSGRTTKLDSMKDTDDVIRELIIL
jgi:hypothetical protein